MKIMWFCIPAHGHTNPTIEVVRELVQRGHKIWYYSFDMFRERIEDTGATFISCDGYLDPLSQQAERRLRKVSTTEMSIQSIHMCTRIDSRLTADVETIKPDLIVTDSACFWGKLIAMKTHLPMVVSTTTFAFNQYSSRYMKYSFGEMADMILGLPRLNSELKALRSLGYQVKSALDLVSSRDDDDAIVYTSRQFQPCADTFDPNHYCFVGPSLRLTRMQHETRHLPFIYISLGTVINSYPDFYRHCMEALGCEPVDVKIACGQAFDISKLGAIPENVSVEPYVDQLEILSRADLFITHCGMNSASEGLYMGVPEILFPLSGEEAAVARRVSEIGAGVLLSKKQANDPVQIRNLVRHILKTPVYREAALRTRAEFIEAGGARRAADFIETRCPQGM